MAGRKPRVEGEGAQARERISPTHPEARTFADLASVAAYRHLLERMDEPPSAPIALRLRKPRQTIYCRPGTSDVYVIAENLLRREGERLLSAPIPRNGRILDLGANIGVTMALFASSWPDARVLGVELDPANAEVCRRNIEPWGDRCELLVGAVWDRDGEVSYTGDSEWALHVARTSRFRAPAFTMPNLLARLGGRAHFVKMDIEGSERRVLRTLGEWRECVGEMRIEIHEPFTPRKCRELMIRHGFRCRLDYYGGCYYVVAHRLHAELPAGSENESLASHLKRA